MVIHGRQFGSIEESVEVWREFDLDLSLNASFVLPLFDKHHDEYVKFYGWSRGLKLRKETNTLKISHGTFREALLLSGAWFNPHVEIKKTERNARNILEEFLGVFPGLGVAINPWDRLAMLYTIFLSRNTDYYRNTVPWMRKILEKAKSEDKLSMVNVSSIGKSYQIKQLSMVKQDFEEIRKEMVEQDHSLNDFMNIRKRILSVKYCGPKIVHGWGLFSLGLTCLSQVDRHLLIIGKSLGIISSDDKIPSKNFCINSRCFINNDCEILNKCITYKLYKFFGDMAGWFQTAVYLYGVKYLRNGMDPYRILRR